MRPACLLIWSILPLFWLPRTQFNIFSLMKYSLVCKYTIGVCTAHRIRIPCAKLVDRRQDHHWNKEKKITSELNPEAYNTVFIKCTRSLLFEDGLQLPVRSLNNEIRSIRKKTVEMLWTFITFSTVQPSILTYTHSQWLQHTSLSPLDGREVGVANINVGKLGHYITCSCGIYPRSFLII